MYIKLSFPEKLITDSNYFFFKTHLKKATQFPPNYFANTIHINVCTLIQNKGKHLFCECATLDHAPGQNTSPSHYQIL